MDNEFDTQEINIVFRDIILLTLTGFISMVVLLVPFINPPTEKMIHRHLLVM